MHHCSRYFKRYIIPHLVHIGSHLAYFFLNYVYIGNLHINGQESDPGLMALFSWWQIDRKIRVHPSLKYFKIRAFTILVLVLKKNCCSYFPLWDSYMHLMENLANLEGSNSVLGLHDTLLETGKIKFNITSAWSVLQWHWSHEVFQFRVKVFFEGSVSVHKAV